MGTSAMETLALIGHFRESDEGKLKQVEAQFAVEEFRKGEMLYRAHDKPDHIFFLDKGAIVLLAEDHDGLVLELERITARGSVIGKLTHVSSHVMNSPWRKGLANFL